MSIEVLEWPAEESRRRELAQLGRPRLLVVGADVVPPVVTDAMEDWIRQPCEPVDLQARLSSLQARRVIELDEQQSPVVDNDGVLRTADGWLALSNVEVGIVSALIERFGTVVDRESLTKAAWPGQEVSRNLLDVYLHKLRPRVSIVGLEIVTVRKRGLLLEHSNAKTAVGQRDSGN